MIKIKEMQQANLSLLSFQKPRGVGSMRESSKMCTVSRMQEMMQIRGTNYYFATNLFRLLNNTFSVRGDESLRGEAIITIMATVKLDSEGASTIELHA